MSKTQTEIQSVLGLTGNETLAELITVLNSYATVTDTELNNIKNISVQTLPTIVRNQEQLVKGRMTNPSINDVQGIPAVLNKRIVLIKLITDKITTELTNAVTKLNGISTGANKVEQSQINGNIKIDNIEKIVYTLPTASTSTVGGVKEGNGVDIAQDGTITVNKQEIGLEIVNNEVVQRKLDKVSTANVVYGTDAQGNQTTYGVSENAENNKLVKRTNTGKINLPNSVILGQSTFATIEQLLDGIVAFISNLSEEVGDLEGTDTSFTETVTALQDRVTELETSWTTFMAGTDADDITDTLISIQTDIENLKTAMEGLSKELIDKSLYHLGAYDSKSGNTITRQSNILNKYNFGTLTYKTTTYSNINYMILSKPKNALDYGTFSNNFVANKFEAYSGANWNSTDWVGKISGLANADEYWIGFSKATTEAEAISAMQDLEIQYKLATSYTEQVIEDESILPLDSNMAQMIRQDVVDSLNLFDSLLSQGYRSGSTTITNHANYLTNTNLINVNANTTYTFNVAVAKANTLLDYVYYFDSSLNVISSTSLGTSNLLLTFTTPSNCKYFAFVFRNASGITPSDVTNIMLNKGSHPYPYEQYHQAKHITDEEATLLKQEEEKCRNLYNPTTQVNGYYIDENYIEHANNLYCYNKIPVKPNTTYNIDGFQDVNSYYCHLSSNGSYLRGGTITKNTTFTTPNDTYYLVISPRQTDNIMLNEGSEAKPYQEWNGEIVHEKQLNEVKENLEERIDDIDNNTTVLDDKIDEIKERLDELGFKEGVSTYSGITVLGNVTNTLKKQGKYCIFNLYGNDKNLYHSGQIATINIPSGFRPKVNTEICIGGNSSGEIIATVTTSGIITIQNPQYPSTSSFAILNVGWELA